MRPQFSPQLRVTPLEFQFQATGLVGMPQYAGALFRGGFGYFFRDLVCTTHQPQCGGCPCIRSCPYSLVFETPIVGEEFRVLRKYPNAPHPFVLVPPLGTSNQIKPGEAFTLQLQLVGSSLEYLPHYIRSLDDMGRSGRFGGPFRLLRVVSGLDAGIVIQDSHTGAIGADIPDCYPEPETAPVHRMTLEFCTPLRMRTRGEYNRPPTFTGIAHGLLQRIRLLAALYAGDDDADWMRLRLADVDRILTEQSTFRLFEWDRKSGRQEKRIPMDGFLGSMTVSGNLTELAPFFRLGEWIHIGSGTSMGLGKYKATFEC